MAKGSEQISTRWVEGMERKCRRCGMEITNLAKQVGEVRYLPRRDILCMSCHMTRSQWLGSKTPPLYAASTSST